MGIEWSAGGASAVGPISRSISAKPKWTSSPPQWRHHEITSDRCPRPSNNIFVASSIRGSPTGKGNMSCPQKVLGAAFFAGNEGVVEITVSIDFITTRDSISCRPATAKRSLDTMKRWISSTMYRAPLKNGT